MYKFGLLILFDVVVRCKVVDYYFECIEIMYVIGLWDLKIWFVDGVNYLG